MWALLSLGSVVLALVGHAVTCRVPIAVDRVTKFLGVGIPLCILLAATLMWAYGPTPELFAGVLMYAFLCELYIFVVTLAASSVSTNLLLALSQGPMAEGEIETRYDSAQMVSKRIERLVSTGFLEQHGQRVRLAPRGKRLLKALDAAARFFGH